MKAKELMTGDWVLIKRTSSYEYPYKICSINNYSILGEDYTDWIEVEESEEIKLEDIEPIPLTAEILEKNGWKDISDHTLKGCETFKLHYEQRSFDFYITIKLRDYFKLESYDDRFYTLCEMEFGCRFVHELQHALRLCGIDKEIVL